MEIISQIAQHFLTRGAQISGVPSAWRLHFIGGI